jgi:undecaprenyl-diphosphatase
VTVFFALLSRPLVEALFSSPLFTGFALLVTGLVLRYGSRIVPRDLPVSLSSGVKVGLAQGLSILPGISRSGMTIVTGLRCGLSPREAFTFSFLLSLPAILGATILEVVKAGGITGVVTSLPAGWWIGMAAGFASGLLALGILRRAVVRGRLDFFAVYCIAAGLFVVGLNMIGG